MPDWKHYVRTHLPALHLNPTRELEIIEELATQLEQAYRDALLAGHDPAQAEHIAASQLPDWKKLASEISRAESPRHTAPSRFWETLPADVRHAWRVLLKSPLFLAVAVLTLAIAIAGCTTMFSLIEAVILRPLAYREPGQLVMVWENQYRRGYHKNVVAMADYLDWKTRNHVFSDMSPVLDQVWNVTGQGDPTVWKGISVNERFLPLLGVYPLLGRPFSTDETRAGGPRVAILSHRIWTERFAASREII
ncbi:MAG: ABC transporter permease, partial [Acidobacteriaceae bacterium]|nr:ABC transporter permease [Acidobacteriaceae bacterium]